MRRGCWFLVRSLLALFLLSPRCICLFGNAAADSGSLRVNCSSVSTRFRRPCLTPAGIRLHWCYFWISQACFVRGKRGVVFHCYAHILMCLLHSICNLLSSTTQSVRHQVLSRHLLCCVLLWSITLGTEGGDPTMQLTKRKGEPRSVPNLPTPLLRKLDAFRIEGMGWDRIPPLFRS